MSVRTIVFLSSNGYNNNKIDIQIIAHFSTPANMTTNLSPPYLEGRFLPLERLKL